jgi:hypothetical protein
LKRVALAILGVVLAVAVLVAIARRNPQKLAAAPRLPVSASAPPPATLVPVAVDSNDVQLGVKDIALADGGADRVSIRIDHPDPSVQAKLKEFLEPREQAAIASNTALDCHAQTAKTSLISLTCVTVMRRGDGDGDGDPRSEPHYESLTLRFARGHVRELALADVLNAEAGPDAVVEGCKKAAEPDLACEWPPTDFAISPGGTLVLCHGPHCIDIDQDDAPNLLRPDFR